MQGMPGMQTDTRCEEMPCTAVARDEAGETLMTKQGRLMRMDFSLEILKDFKQRRA